jgi:protein-S-isoprenylcysteine O-methyltransferase Ste14
MFLLTLYGHEDGMNIPRAAGAIWIALGLVWVIGAIFRRSAGSSFRQSTGAFLFQSAIAALAICLVATDWLRIGWLAARFVPSILWIQYLGLALTLAGCFFAAWARIALGGNWSARPTVQQNHALVEDGPYALTRHPIYTGFLSAFAGTALVLGEYRALLALALLVLRFLLKIGNEEQLMLQAFPDEYPDYRRRVKALIPGLF